MAETTVKDEMRQALDRLPDDATWDDVAHIVAMHELLARARKNRAEGKVYTTEEMKVLLGVPDES